MALSTAGVSMAKPLDDQLRRYQTRILASVEVDANGCWIWQKKRSRNGYGDFAFGGGKNGRAHRVSYAAFVGPIPNGMDVCHKCDVRPCVNPNHLFVGTRSQNILDAVRKGRICRDRRVRGEQHHASKLTASAVRDIRERLANGEAKASIARSYSVSDRTILLISRNEIWAHVKDETA